jgi:hypothetical protein
VDTQDNIVPMPRAMLGPQEASAPQGFTLEDILWAIGSSHLSGSPANKKRAVAARSLLVLLDSGVSDHAACLCIAPLADAVPRIALIERSIAAHSLPISAAARPSA